MKLLYFPVFESDICFCDAPPGTALLWPRSKRIVLPNRTLPAEAERWKVPPVAKEGPPLCRVIPLSQEIGDGAKAFATTLRRVVKKLPKSRQNRGVLCVMLKGGPFKVPKEGVFRYVGFFHVKSMTAWTKLWNGTDPTCICVAPPPGWPTRV